MDLKQSSLYARDVVIYQCRIVKNMEKILLNLNASIAVAQLNGFVGETHISVIHATKDNVLEIMCQNTPKISFQNAQASVSVQSAETMMETGNKRCWAVQFVETTNKTTKVSDLI